METVLARAGWWLVALFVAILAVAGAKDTGFAIHMSVFAIAALIGLVVSLRRTDYVRARSGLPAPPAN